MLHFFYLFPHHWVLFPPEDWFDSKAECNLCYPLPPYMAYNFSPTMDLKCKTEINPCYTLPECIKMKFLHKGHKNSH